MWKSKVANRVAAGYFIKSDIEHGDKETTKAENTAELQVARGAQVREAALNVLINWTRPNTLRGVISSNENGTRLRKMERFNGVFSL